MKAIVMTIARFAIDAMLTTASKWARRNTDYRLSDLETGLWQASQSLKALIRGEFDTHRQREHVRSGLGKTL